MTTLNGANRKLQRIEARQGGNWTFTFIGLGQRDMSEEERAEQTRQAEQLPGIIIQVRYDDEVWKSWTFRGAGIDDI